MILKIQGGPDSPTVRVMDSETDQEITGVHSLQIFAEQGQPVRAELVVIPQAIDIVAEANLTYVCPHCHKQMIANTFPEMHHIPSQFEGHATQA